MVNITWEEIEELKEMGVLPTDYESTVTFLVCVFFYLFIFQTIVYRCIGKRVIASIKKDETVWRVCKIHYYVFVVLCSLAFICGRLKDERHYIHTACDPFGCPFNSGFLNMEYNMVRTALALNSLFCFTFFICWQMAYVLVGCCRTLRELYLGWHQPAKAADPAEIVAMGYEKV